MPFEPGKSGNPAQQFSSEHQPETQGRKKGSRSRSTLIKKWLEVSQHIKNPITGDFEDLEQEDIMILSMIKEARKGNVQAFKELMDSAHGKLTDNIDHTSGGEKIAFSGIQIIKPNDPDQEIRP